MTYSRLGKPCNKQTEKLKTTIDLPHNYESDYLSCLMLRRSFLLVNTNCDFPWSAMLVARFAVTISRGVIVALIYNLVIG